MSERFDLEKWLREHEKCVARTPQPYLLRKAVTAAENHQRELLGCGHPRACGHFHIDLRGFPSDRVCHCDMPEAQRKICTVCAELSRVRQQARAEERASHILVDPCSRWTTDDVVKKLQEAASKVAHTTYPKWKDGTEVDTCTVDCPHCAIAALIPTEVQGDSPAFFTKAFVEDIRKDIEANEYGRLIESRVSERTAALTKPMDCGHPRACWIPAGSERLPEVSVNDGAPAAASPAIWDKPVVVTFDLGHCTVCAELSRVRQQAKSMKARRGKLR